MPAGVVGSRVLFVGSKYPGRLIAVRPEDAPAFSLVCILPTCAMLHCLIYAAIQDAAAESELEHVLAAYSQRTEVGALTYTHSCLLTRISRGELRIMPSQSVNIPHHELVNSPNWLRTVRLDSYNTMRYRAHTLGYNGSDNSHLDLRLIK